MTFCSIGMHATDVSKVSFGIRFQGKRAVVLCFVVCLQDALYAGVLLCGLEGALLFLLCTPRYTVGQHQLCTGCLESDGTTPQTTAVPSAMQHLLQCQRSHGASCPIGGVDHLRKATCVQALGHCRGWSAQSSILQGCVPGSCAVA